MANTRLFDSSQIKEGLPYPFDEEVKKEKDRRYSTKEEYCSCHNVISRGKKAALFPAVLQAILCLIRAEEEKSKIAAGAQISEGSKAVFYCMEYALGAQQWILLYNPQNGQIKTRGAMEKQKHAAIPFQVQEGKNSGEPLLALFAYASMEEEGALYDQEFKEHYNVIKELYRNGWADRKKLMQSAYICCDNLFCRIENGANLGRAGIPFDKERYGQGTFDFLSEDEISSGIYSPNKTVWGRFVVFQARDRKKEYEIADMQAEYGRNLNLSRDECRLIPNFPSSYKVREGVKQLLEAVRTTPERIFMLTGSSGVGKTTDAQIMAQILGYPYYFFTCGPDTDELTLISSMVPNTQQNGKRGINFPAYEDMLMDPASALQQISGRYEKGIQAEDAFAAILEMVYQAGYREAKTEKDFAMVESSLIKGCEGPSVIEIQEPFVIERSAAMVKLNALLDDTAAITLLNGETIYRHPDTIIILTTNLNYAGCRSFNESVLSRIHFVQHRGDLTAEEMIQRAMRKTGFQNRALLEKMAEIALKIREHIQEEEIRGGICEYREYENWIWSFIAKKNILEAARDTIIGKASMDAREREEMMELYIYPYFNDAA